MSLIKTINQSCVEGSGTISKTSFVISLLTTAMIEQCAQNATFAQKRLYRQISPGGHLRNQPQWSPLRCLKSDTRFLMLQVQIYAHTQLRLKAFAEELGGQNHRSWGGRDKTGILWAWLPPLATSSQDAKLLLLKRAALAHMIKWPILIVPSLSSRTF